MPQTYSPSDITVRINGRSFQTHVEQAAAATGQDPQDITDALNRLSERHRDEFEYERASGDRLDALAYTLGLRRDQGQRYFDLSRDGSGRIERPEPESDEDLRRRVLQRLSPPFSRAGFSHENELLAAVHQPQISAAAWIQAAYDDWERLNRTQVLNKIDEIFQPAEPPPTLWDHLLGAE